MHSSGESATSLATRETFGRSLRAPVSLGSLMGAKESRVRRRVAVSARGDLMLPLCLD